MMFEECFGNGPFIFRINENGGGPMLLMQVCLERGWREYNGDTESWNLWWRTSGFPISHHRNLYAWQYINHIPKGSSICRKDNLVRYLRCMRKVYGSIYDFSPHGYNLPLEYTKLAAECSRARSHSKDDVKYFEDKPIWICKPVAQSQGRGIFLFRKLSELNYDTNTIVQRYIEKPLLIGGYKFDLRLYVCIPSYHPVTIYMYREGLARFGTDKFSLNDLRNPFRHLTNSSINKLGPGYTEMKDRVGSGCKWTLRQLRRYFQQAGILDWLLWQRITSLVILTVLSHVNQIPPTVNCFEFFGFDVLIDSSLRPWLLEVNLSPALSNDCDADRLVKKPMLHDMFDLLGLPLYNTGLAVFDIFSDEPVDDRNTDQENKNMSLINTISVVNAAGRWRRKQKKMSATCSRSSSAIRVKSRAASANSSQRTYITLPKVHVDVRAVTSPVHNGNTKQGCDDYKKPESKSWGNGRDWNYPKSREGGWIRIWPFSLETPNKNSTYGNNGHMKNMVNEVIKFTKKAKELARKHSMASECQLSEYLQADMEMTGDIWIPPV
ncbi:probable tubulin polyglutamylase TTLL2 isoform X1 [Diorhabda carinulata]|uniref:probable tubulin polyglutamylase TTLL2 isoform X1 n=1 Tax=Diorhabda carinulata TaxID=1163345 RepID=UPI0025A1DFE0|nr:probable tubulin polyglutamylase TTLL2 isoform X1 [Diorhabda carinulata]XP_057667586.1 probable tubulin polyglutamylase TTLL2 isoform X1 [Diorhabda carinulata]